MAEALHDHTVLERAPDALSRRLLDGVLILTPAMDEATRLSAPGDRVWELLAGPITFADLVQTLAAQFDAPATTVRADLEPMMTTLQSSGAVIVTG